MEPNQKSCAACGSTVEKDAAFCPSCGAKQEAQPASESVQIPGMPDLTPPDFTTPDFTPPSFDVSAPPEAVAPAAAAAPPEAAAPAQPPTGTGYTPPSSPAQAQGQPAAPTTTAYTGYTPPQNGYSSPAGGYSVPTQNNGYAAPQQNSGYTPPPQNGGYTAPGYSGAPMPGGATYSQPPFGTTVQQPKKKNPAAAIVIAILLIAAIAGGIFIFNGNAGSSFDVKTYTSPLVWDGTVAYTYDDYGYLAYSFNAMNTSDKTIVYMETWVYHYDANGNRILDDDGDNWYPQDYDSLYVRPGNTFSPEEYGYWYSWLPDVEYMYIYVSYLEYSDGSWEGMPYWVDSDFTWLQIESALDYVNEIADTWAKQQAN